MTKCDNCGVSDNERRLEIIDDERLCYSCRALREHNADLKKPIPNADIQAIVADYLQKHGYDGLYQANECACLLESLFPCDAPGLDCRPGYLQSMGDDGDFRIGPEK